MYDLYGLGNALVDKEYTINDQFLVQHNIAKGHMTLVDEDRLEALTKALVEHAPDQASGGSAANTILAAQGFGCKTFYSCRVARDATGNYFLRDLADAGITVNNNAAGETGTSGRCLVLVTPDAERSMNTFLGCSSELNEEHIDEAALARARYFYVEGYLSSSPTSMTAAIACRELAEREGVATAVSLSDPSMVEIFRDQLALMLGNGVDHLFCNEEEALSWTRTDRLDLAVRELSDIARHINITLGARGSLVVTPDGQSEVQGIAVKAIDTNGAGDMYAGACLAALSQGFDDKAAAGFANLAAARLVERYGARFKQLSEYRVLRQQFAG